MQANYRLPQHHSPTNPLNHTQIRALKIPGFTVTFASASGILSYTGWQLA